MDRLPATAAAAEGSTVEFGWSTEKHAAYLHSHEVSFVRRVFGSTAADHFQYYHLNGYDDHHQPLDRHLPDSGDSTLDSTNLDLNHAKQYPAPAAEGKVGSSVEFGWTNEKHFAYLHSLEVSFVQRVFGSTAADHFQYYHLNGYDYHHQPLDRHLPDCCESTLDSTTLDLNHAKQSCDAGPLHSNGKMPKKSKKRRTSLAQKAPQKDQHEGPA